MKYNKFYVYALAAFLTTGCATTPTTTTSTTAEAPVADADRLREAAPKYAATITAADLAKHLHIIASDEYEGRLTGSNGQQMPAEYISREFKEDGLVGPVKTNSNPYYQPVNLERSQWGEGYLMVGKQKFMMGQDFFVLGASPYQTEQTAEVVFAGYGIDADNYSDYANLDVTGKMVVVLGGEPKSADGKFLVSGSDKASDWGNDFRTKRNAATKRGAKSVLVVTGANAGEFGTMTQRYRNFLSRPSIGLKSNGSATGTPSAAAMLVSPQVGAALLGTTPEK